ncbi:MAG: hypothetical protein DSM107014_11715 [Gomphosphaeria aponina SAG 52.96 = DSM 107014]|uniref:Uncharacterized protein n=1 Tax=Gomphosphaeria aponina SAG 52.96 = DSM 107014 TaxID=1521640 RepID=A0A941GS97_9CHRO|nr:hypothetical protein [Gomphosphaeria aponina SAG 52.96 = DSM 107014]
MFAVEFKANIKNGFIEIPDAYKQEFEHKKNVQVILLKEEKVTAEDLLEQLLSDPIEVENFSPLKREEIYER